MNKKTTIILLLTLVCFSIVLAQDESNMTEYEDDLRIMTNSRGVVVRFLQLERQINLKILRGERVVEYLLGLDAETSVSEFNEILDQLQVLGEEASEYTNPEAIIDVSSIATTYVDLKRESIELVQEFRTALHSLLSEEQQDELELIIESLNETSIEPFGQRVRNMIREYNYNRVRNALQNMNASDEGLVDEVSNGNLSKGQIIQRLRNRFNSTQEAVRAIRLRQELTQDEVLSSAINEIASTNVSARRTQVLERVAQRLENRTNLRSNASQVVERINTRIRNVVAVNTRIRNVVARIINNRSSNHE